MFKIDTATIKIPRWPTPQHKVTKAFNDGKLHALNHYYDEEPDPDWPYGVKSWSVNPYSENRPAAFYSWIAGFCEQWADLVRDEKET
jgi:hypothetical protein